NGTQERRGFHPQRTRQRRPAARRQGIRGRPRRGGCDHRPSARDKGPPRQQRWRRKGPHALRAHRGDRGIQSGTRRPPGRDRPRPRMTDKKHAMPALYGGQAVIEGVMIRGRRTVALACRKPNGDIYRYREPLRSPLVRSHIARLPFVRGVVVLWESLDYGIRMLMRSAEVQLEQEEQLGKGGNTLIMGVALVGALLLFIGVPYLATSLARAVIPSSVVLNVTEGLIRLALLVGYLVAISFLPDVRRVFAYHGAEHMTIHAFEH